MNASMADIIVLAYILIALIGLLLIGLLGLRTRAIWLERQTSAYSRKHHEYFEYVKSHLHEETPLRKPIGELTRTELHVIQNQLFQWMEKIVGAERERLTALCRELGLVEMNIRRLRSEIHWNRLDAAYNLGVMQAAEAVPLLLQLLEEESYGSPAFVIARAVSKSTREEADLDRMVRLLAKHGKRSHRLIVELLQLSRVDSTALFLEYLNEKDEELVQVALTGLHNRSIPEAHAVINPWLQAENPELRLLAAQALVRQIAQLSGEQVAELMQHEDALIRSVVADALGQSGHEDWIGLLREGLSDEDWRVRLNSAQGLMQLQESGFRALCEVAAGGMEAGRDAEAANLASEVIQEELTKGTMYLDDFEEAKQHNRRLGIYRQFFQVRESGRRPIEPGLRLSKGDPA